MQDSEFQMFTYIDILFINMQGGGVGIEEETNISHRYYSVNPNAYPYLHDKFISTSLD
ncbi:hypothetical protein GCM10011389_21270 [Pontibacillus salipaludis]|uniref:Uncharacterized protein n=1 Tax=Pontibacillus salipaludis TaxID=1697394 RepID=A0ABQ1Q5F8_9BACI|nr:hypothetical protein GCM10011389_21270 [Pontibacillus salipaludis]